jgi:hypothetical protein
MNVVKARKAIIKCHLCFKQATHFIYENQIFIVCPHCKADIDLKTAVYVKENTEEPQILSKEEITKQLTELLNRAGIVDFFFVGVKIDNSDAMLFGWGRDKSEYNNAIRYNRLLGLMEDCKFSMMMAARLSDEPKEPQQPFSPEVEL